MPDVIVVVPTVIPAPPLPAAQVGTPAASVSIYPSTVAANFDNAVVDDAYKISPTVYPVCPVPP